MKYRTVQRLSCAAAMVAATAFSCGNFTNRVPATETIQRVIARESTSLRMEHDPIGSRIGRWGKTARGYAFAGSRTPLLYRVAEADMLRGPYKDLPINEDARVDAQLDSLGQSLTIIATHGEETERCKISTKEMGNVALVPVDSDEGLHFYLIRLSSKGVPLKEDGLLRAKRIEVSFSTVVAVDSETSFEHDGQQKTNRVRVEGLIIHEREVLVPESR